MNIIARMAGNRDGPQLDRMDELPMTTASSVDFPPSFFSNLSSARTFNSFLPQRGPAKRSLTLHYPPDGSPGIRGGAVCHINATSSGVRP